MTNFLGHLFGTPLILAGFFLTIVAEGLIRAGAWLSGRTVVVVGRDDV